MSHPSASRLLTLLAIALFTVVFAWPSRAFAHDIPALPAHATSAVVRVDAYEHATLGAVIGDGHLVLVPLVTVEVARPGWPHATVIDAAGKRHDAGIAATDRASGLALLAVEHPLTPTPFKLSPHTMADAIDTFAVSRGGFTGPVVEGAWAFYPAGALAALGRVVVAPHSTGYLPPPQPGAPVIDVEGRLIAITSEGMLIEPHALAISEAVLARLDGSLRERRPLIFYGGVTFPVSFALDGGAWVGLGISFAARYRDIVELRLDGEFSALAPVTHVADRACGSSCYAGVRGVLTPSIGYRQVLGGFGGSRAFPIAITPSVGIALGLQDTRREHGASHYDATTPSTWAQLAPGLSLSLWAFEVQGRVRVPLDGNRSPTTEVGVGVWF